MKATVPTFALLAFLVAGGVTFAVIQWLGRGSPEMAFVAGAVVGTQVAAVVHHRTPRADSSAGVKAGVGAALAVGTVLLGAALHAGWKPFQFPGVSIPISVVGAFVFPFVLFDTMWDSLSKKRGS